VRNAHDRARDFDSERLAPHVRDALFHDRHYVVLFHERHLDVELRELRLPVRARILIPKTTRDLHVTAEAADHEDLFE
jgi:hypothetical protein